MPDFSRVIEESPKEYFKVVHRVIRIPKEVYLDSVGGDSGDMSQTFMSEEAAQRFISQYLQWKEPHSKGIVGMVRGEEKSDEVLLDAAIRYPLYLESRH